MLNSTYASWLNESNAIGPAPKFVLEGSDFAKHKDLELALQAYLRWRNKNKRKAIILRQQNKIKVV